MVVFWRQLNGFNMTFPISSAARQSRPSSQLNALTAPFRTAPPTRWKACPPKAAPICPAWLMAPDRAESARFCPSSPKNPGGSGGGFRPSSTRVL